MTRREKLEALLADEPELGEPAVPGVRDVLQVGGPSRRLLAADVLI